jgi:hypothetical protein
VGKEFSTDDNGNFIESMNESFSKEDLKIALKSVLKSYINTLKENN